jgi:hypothetical protein
MREVLLGPRFHNTRQGLIVHSSISLCLAKDMAKKLAYLPCGGACLSPGMGKEELKGNATIGGSDGRLASSLGIIRQLPELRDKATEREQ